MRKGIFMNQITISLRDDMKAWLEREAAAEGYASVDELVGDLIQTARDRRRPVRQLTMDELRQMIEDGRSSGISDKTVEEIFEDARRLVAARRRNLA
jgi:antitoxin ParD1/3/4